MGDYSSYIRTEQTRFMAAPAPMELSDSSEMNKRHGLLAVNKSSGKIQKGIRRPVAQPRPAPTVYKIEAGHFRSLVQELTGTAPSDPAPPKPAGNSRLQKFAPPPLRPTFSYAKLVQPSPTLPNGMQLSNPSSSQRFNGMQFSGFGSSLSPLSQRISPFPMLSPHSFSPLPALSPSDQIWVNPLDSPSSAAMRQLAQSMAASENQNNLQQQQQQQQQQQEQQQLLQQQQEQSQQPQQQVDSLRMDNINGGASILGAFPPLSPSNFNLSPRFPSQYSNLPSPVGLGMASGFGINNVYNMGTLNSPTAGLAMDFAFPEPDFVSTGFS